MFNKITKNTIALGVGTFTSRTLGFIRDILIAKYFGTSALLESFIVAFRIPNLLRSLLGEGFSDSVATPALSIYHRDKSKLFAVSNDLIFLFTLILMLVTLGGVFLSRYLVMAAAPGFISDAYKFGLAVSFTRITFFYLFFIGLSANLKSIFYALGKFSFPAFSPCLFNIPFIIGIVFFRGVFNNFILVACVIAGGVLEFLFLYFFIRRQGFRVRFNYRRVLRDQVVFKMFKAFLPRVWSALTYQLNVFIDTIFSSLSVIAGTGALAAIYYANRLIQLPLALIALSVSRVAIVDLSRYYEAGKFREFKELFIFSFQNIILFIIPLSIVFLFVSQDITRIIFFRGEAQRYSLSITSSAFFFYSLGLLSFCEIKLLVNAFYSLGDTLTPAKTAAVSLLVNVVLSAILMFPLKIGGIALASSIAATVNFFLLWQALIRKIGRIDCRIIYREAVKLVIIGLILGAADKALFAVHINIFIQVISAAVIDYMLFLVLGRMMKVKQMGGLTLWLTALRRK